MSQNEGVAIVKVNRELLTDVVDDLVARHNLDLRCCHTGPCPTQQRLERVLAVMERAA